MIHSHVSRAPAQLQAQLAALGLDKSVSAIAVKPAHQGGEVEIPGWLHPAVAGATQAQGYSSLYPHQVEAISAAVLEGKDVAITTPTASGKSLAFQVPILQAAVADRQSGQAFRSLYLAPTKALIADQQDKCRSWMMGLAQAGEDMRVVTLTGDTPGDRALLFRPVPDVILSNPDCVNNLLFKQRYPQFAGLKLFLRQLRYVVLDEVQSYVGIFGCNVANLIKRIRLAVVRAGGTADQIQFILASATIGNPRQMWQTLCGREPSHPFALVKQNTAPFAGRVEVFCNGKGASKAGVCRLVNALISEGKTTILFVESRRLGRELMHLIRREQRRLGRPESAVAQFHGTLSSSKRREIAGKIRSGALKLIVATSALEQGVDFPQIDAAIVWGFPDVNRLYQRFGRAGRGSTVGLAIFIPNLQRSVDQYYARQGKELAESRPGSVFLNPNYAPRLRRHILAAAGESGISLRGELMPFFGNDSAKAALALQQEGELEVRGGYLVADPKAALAVAMRGSRIDKIQLVEADAPDLVIEEFSRTLALREVHPGAIYAAYDEAGEFRKWRVTSLNLEQGQATAQALNPESAFSTRPTADLKVEVDESVTAQVQKVCFGRADSPATLTLILQWGTITNRVIGYETLLTTIQVGCFNPECSSYNKPLLHRFGNCSQCNRPLQIAKSKSEMVKDTVFESPLSEQYQAPILTIIGDDEVALLLNNLAKGLKQRLYQAYDQIPLWHEELLMQPPEGLGLHTLSHLLLAALPTQSQPIAASDLLLAELGQPPQIILFDEVELGTGSCEFIYEQFEQLLSHAYHLAAECDCQEGCPKCCHTHHCGVRNGAIYRPLGEAFLEAVLNR